MRTLQKVFNGYAAAIPANASKTQRRETELAFYAGAHATFQILGEASENLTEDQACHVLDGISDEIDIKFKQLKNNDLDNRLHTSLLENQRVTNSPRLLPCYKAHYLRANIMGRYMTSLYLGTGNDGYHTGIGAEFETDAETTEAFESAKALDTDIKTAPFIIDLREANGDIVDSIAVSEEGYKSITGEPVLSEAEYIEIDREYWAVAEQNYKKQLAL